MLRDPIGRKLQESSSGSLINILGMSIIRFLMSVAFLIASLFVGPKTEGEEADE